MPGSTQFRARHATYVLPPLWIALTLLLFSTAAPAKVFMRWGGSSSEKIAQAVLGDVAHRTEVVVNGGPAAVTVLHCPGPLRTLVARLQRSAGNTGVFSSAGQSMAMGFMARDDKITRVIVLAPEGREACTVFLVEQAADAFRASQTPDIRSDTGPMPPYPGGTVVFDLHDRGSRTHLLTMTAPSLPATVRAHYRDRLLRQGWQIPRPQNGLGDRPGMTLFQRGMELCCVSATETDVPGTTRITVLHKRLSVE